MQAVLHQIRFRKRTFLNYILSSNSREVQVFQKFPTLSQHLINGCATAPQLFADCIFITPLPCKIFYLFVKNLIRKTT